MADTPHTTIRLSEAGRTRLDWLQRIYGTQTAAIEQALEVLHTRHTHPQSAAADDVLATAEKHLGMALGAIRGEMARRSDEEEGA